MLTLSAMKSTSGARLAGGELGGELAHHLGRAGAEDLDLDVRDGAAEAGDGLVGVLSGCEV